MIYQWVFNRIQSIATVVGAYSSMCALCATLSSIAVLLVVSLIPLYLNEDSYQALGEFYCINNYSLRVGFQIPEYNATFNDTMASRTYSLTSNTVGLPISTGSCTISGTCQGSATETVSITDLCTYQLKSIISPAVPNAKVFNSYALDEACYRTLQTCHYDELLTSCLLSNCIVTSLSDSTGSASSPLTYYKISCTANVYYKTRCLDSTPSHGLFYSSSQKNSACRQQRLNRINACFNSSVALLNVPCVISVSSGLVTTTSGSCTQTITTNTGMLFIYNSSSTLSSSTLVWSSNPSTNTSGATFQYAGFSVSDQSDGHAYRISSVNSETYSSSQVGARYCGALTRTQIASAINTAISSQSSG